MPTYVYGCRVCLKEFEVDQRITEDALTDCDCGAVGGLRRLIQPVAVSFKGAGFHINDYAAPAAGSSASGSSGSSAASVGTEQSAPATSESSTSGSPAAEPKAAESTAPTPVAPAAPTSNS